MDGRDGQSNDGTALVYPLQASPGIGDGSSVTIAPGVQWLRMPIGSDLGFINVWALADGDGWTLVDTGFRTPQTVEAWHRAFTDTLAGRPIRRIRQAALSHPQLLPMHGGWRSDPDWGA